MINSIESLIIENKNFIYKIASKYSRYYNIEDLFQVGVIGFIKAYKNYKNSGAKFTTYAHKYVLGEIIEFIKNDRTMKISDDYLKIYKSYEKVSDYLTNELNRIPTLEEISKFMNIDINLLNEVIIKSEFVISLDASLNEDNFTLENIVGCDKTQVIDNLIDLKNELSKLSKEERRLIELRYMKDYTQSETADILGISQVQVSRSESKVLKKIKTNIAV